MADKTIHDRNWIVRNIYKSSSYPFSFRWKLHKNDGRLCFPFDRREQLRPASILPAGVQVQRDGDALQPPAAHQLAASHTSWHHRVVSLLCSYPATRNRKKFHRQSSEQNLVIFYGDVKGTTGRCLALWYFGAQLFVTSMFTLSGTSTWTPSRSCRPTCRGSPSSPVCE